MIHKCKYCDYESVYRANVRRHENNKHGVQEPISQHAQLKTSYMQGYPQVQPVYRGQVAHQQPVHNEQVPYQQYVEVKNNQINKKEIKVEDVPLLVIRKTAHKDTINPMVSAIQNMNTSNDLRQRVRLKKINDLLPKKESASLQMKRRHKRKIIQDCCSTLSKIIKKLEKIEPPRRRVSD